jgi:hypothetical protein
MSLNLISKVYAAELPEPTTVLIQSILTNIVNPVITLLVVVAVIIFLWGVFEFIRAADSPEGRKQGGKHILFGSLGLFIMASAYGILNLILGTIGK